MLEQTAFKSGLLDQEPAQYAIDPDDYRNNGSHYVRGHGMVDGEAAVAFALAYDAASSPVVHGEGAAPAAGSDAGDLLAAEPSSESTPGLATVFVVCTVLLVVMLRRRR